MTDGEELAARLRQAVQGCAIHNHGPIQAWAAIEHAHRTGLIQAAEVARLAIADCVSRIEVLKREGADHNDFRIQKEELTRSFIENLFGEVKVES